MKIFVRERNNQGKYDAFLASPDGKRLCFSRQPLLDSARILSARGIDPNERLEMWREGTANWALAGTVRGLAKFTVQERNHVQARLAPFRPFPAAPAKA